MPPDSKWKFFEGEDLAQNLESGIFYASKAFARMPNLFRTTKQKEKRLAKKELPRLIKDHLEAHESGLRRVGKIPTVAELIEEINQTETPGLRPKTQRKRKFYFTEIRDAMGLGPIPMDRFTLSIFTARLDRLLAKKTRRTSWDYFKHGNILNRYAYQQKYVSHRVTFPNRDPKSNAGTVLTVEEILQLWSVMNETTRDQFVLAYECCMRLREALHLTWDRVDLESGEITLRAQDVKTGSKTGKGRQFIMTPHALERILARWNAVEPGESNAHKFVFPSPSGKGPMDDNKIAWGLAKDRALKGNEKRAVKPMPHFQHWVRWHDLRHTAISRMLVEQKINITLVSEYVGTSVSTLQKVYLHSRAEHTKGVTAALRIMGEKK